METSNKINKKNAFSAMDSMALKGVAIIIMMFHHCFLNPERYEGYTVDFSPLGETFVGEISYIFKICVSLFAFVSGYGLYSSAKNKCNDMKTTEQWVISRLIKTLSGFWVVYVLIFAFAQIYASFPQETYCIKGNASGIVFAVIDFLGLANLLGTPTLVSTWWYMSAAIIFIVLVPIIIKFMNKFGVVALLVSVFAIPRLLGGGYPGGTTPTSFVIALVLGVVFARYDLFAKLDNIKLTKFSFLNEIISIVVMIVLLVASFYMYLRLALNSLWEYHYGLCAIIFIQFCRVCIIRIPVIKQILIFLGKHSMNVFLIHTFIRYTFFKPFTYSFEHFLLIVVVLLAISTGLSFVIVEPLKKLIKYDKLINKFTDKVTSLIVDKS